MVRKKLCGIRETGKSVLKTEKQKKGIKLKLYENVWMRSEN
jgi:hypothetical protein